ncbi:MAG TPA: hypothetical protein DIC60_04630 [Lachnospiraceae bacterium]|nr:hypothetical protein [Lachnospiraceae bacterium]
MKFSDYAQSLSPFCSGGMAESSYFTELIGNYIQDAAMDACKILQRKEDTRYRYIKGTRNIQARDAQYIYDHRDTDKFSKWIDEQMENSDSYEAVSKWLDDCEITHGKYDISNACATLLESVFLEITKGSDVSSDTAFNYGYDFALVDEIRKKIKSLPRPADVPVPKEVTHEEHDYINALYCAYGDAESKNTFDESDLSSYSEYQEDVNDRRIDFYAAESIHRGVMELGKGGLSDQFDVLKGETYDGVKDTAKRTHPNGYERMLAVMEQAVNSDVKNYVLSASPYWISGKIKKGVCHHLVNDGRLKWVKKKK